MELEKRKRNPNLDETTNDLIEAFIQLKDENGSQLSDEEVLDNLVSLVVAGYVSTALAAMWAVYYLAKFPKVLQKLRVCLLQIVRLLNTLLT